MKTKWRMRSCVSNCWNVIYVVWCSLWFSLPRLFDIFFSSSFFPTIHIWKILAVVLHVFIIAHSKRNTMCRVIRTSHARSHTVWIKKKWKTHGKLCSRTKTSRPHTQHCGYTRTSHDRVNEKKKKYGRCRWASMTPSTLSLISFFFSVFSENIPLCEYD